MNNSIKRSTIIEYLNCLLHIVINTIVYSVYSFIYSDIRVG